MRAVGRIHKRDVTGGSSAAREHQSERLAAAFEWPMLIASLLVVPTIAIENAGLGPGWTAVATILNWAIWLAFLTEFVVLLAVAPNRGRWLAKHPLEVAIVVLTPPFGPPGLQSARAFRLLRLLRLLRIAKLARSLFSLDGVKWAALIAFLLVEACGVGLVVVEGHSHQPHLTMVDGLWWSMSTVTTVGYGDVTAVTAAGRLIGMLIMVIGLGFVAVITGAVAHYIIARQTEEAEDTSTAEILAALQRVHVATRLLSERLDRLETRLDGGEGAMAPLARPRPVTAARASRPNQSRRSAGAKHAAPPTASEHGTRTG